MNLAKLLFANLVIIAVTYLPGSAECQPSFPYNPASFRITASKAIGLGPSVLWIDARGEALFHQKHVPGAIHLNESNWAQALTQLSKAYTPGKTIIVYCYPRCDESQIIAVKIQSLGFQPVLVLNGGFEAWQNAVKDLRTVSPETNKNVSPVRPTN